MRVRSDSVRVVALLVALGLPTLACSKKPQGAKQPESAATGVSPEQPAGDPLAQLHSLEQEMRRLGLPVAAERALVPPAEGADEAIADGDAAVGSHPELAEEEVEPPEPRAAAETAPRPEKRELAQRCSAVCDLAGAICDLELQICSLSEQHGGEPTYTDACRRAGEDCVTASDACDRCQS